jgi:hypothetical protein
MATLVPQKSRGIARERPYFWVWVKLYFFLENVFLWKCHKETPCVAILNKQNVIFFFFKIGKQEDRTDPGCGVRGGWYQ